MEENEVKEIEPQLRMLEVFRENMVDIMAHRNVTKIVDLATFLDMPYPTVYHIFKASRSPSWGLIQKLSNKLGVHPCYWFLDSLDEDQNHLKQSYLYDAEEVKATIKYEE